MRFFGHIPISTLLLLAAVSPALAKDAPTPYDFRIAEYEKAPSNPDRDKYLAMLLGAQKFYRLNEKVKPILGKIPNLGSGFPPSVPLSPEDRAFLEESLLAAADFMNGNQNSQMQGSGSDAYFLASDLHGNTQYILASYEPNLTNAEMQEQKALADAYDLFRAEISSLHLKFVNTFQELPEDKREKLQARIDFLTDKIKELRRRGPVKRLERAMYDYYRQEHSDLVELFRANAENRKMKSDPAMKAMAEEIEKMAKLRLEFQDRGEKVRRERTPLDRDERIALAATVGSLRARLRDVSNDANISNTLRNRITNVAYGAIDESYRLMQASRSNEFGEGADEATKSALATLAELDKSWDETFDRLESGTEQVNDELLKRLAAEKATYESIQKNYAQDIPRDFMSKAEARVGENFKRAQESLKGLDDVIAFLQQNGGKVPAGSTPKGAKAWDPSKPKCEVTDDAERNALAALVEGIRSGTRAEIKTVDGFLGALPESLRRNFLYMTGTRSLQGGSVKNPRVLLTSPNNDVSFSFGLDPDLPGYNRIEMMVWNPRVARFEFSEIVFPLDGKYSPDDSEKPHVIDNPAICTSCHGNPPRPNWDTYRLWYGLTPFNGDSVCPGTEEGKWLADYGKRAAAGETRLRHLVQGGPVGMGVRYFDLLTRKNQCRIGHDVQRNKNFNAYRYAMAIAVMCQGEEELLSAMPDWAKERAFKFFEAQGVSVNRQLKDGGIFPAIREQTKKRQDLLHQDKIARQRELFQLNLGKEAGDAEMKKHEACRLQNDQEQSNFLVASLRFAIEPFEAEGDAKMNGWSMSIDPATYTFADNFNPAGFSAVLDVQTEFRDEEQSNPFTKRRYNGNFCRWAAKKSLAAFESLDGGAPGKRHDCIQCDHKVLSKDGQIADGGDELRETQLAILREQAHTILDKNCASCHTYGGFDNAPLIGFNKKEFEPLIKDTAGKAGLDWSQRIWSRINRKHGEHGHMPLNLKSLSKEDRAVLLNYMNLLREQANPRAGRLTDAY